jgi:predicted  nucleic acid-binding Zn-ribbon protein
MKSNESVSFQLMVEQLKGVENGLMTVLRELRKKIEALEKERASLLAEVENLKKVAEAKAGKLENEVSKLREEVKALKELLGETE